MTAIDLEAEISERINQTMGAVLDTLNSLGIGNDANAIRTIRAISSTFSELETSLIALMITSSASPRARGPRTADEQPIRVREEETQHKGSIAQILYQSRNGSAIAKEEAREAFTDFLARAKRAKKTISRVKGGLRRAIRNLAERDRITLSDDEIDQLFRTR